MRIEMKMLLALAAIILAAAASLVGYKLISDRLVEDPGVKVCKQVRENLQLPDDERDTDPITEQEYQQIRDLLQDTRHDKIRTHGTKLLDLTWQLQQFGPEPGLEALPLVQPFWDAYTGFSGACADQGVILPAQPQG